jgi:hypothetical protein
MQIYIHIYIYNYANMCLHIHKQFCTKIYNLITHFSFHDTQNFESNFIFYKDCYHFSCDWIIDSIFKYLHEVNSS